MDALLTNTLEYPRRHTLANSHTKDKILVLEIIILDKMKT